MCNAKKCDLHPKQQSQGDCIAFLFAFLIFGFRFIDFLCASQLFFAFLSLIFMVVGQMFQGRGFCGVASLLLLYWSNKLQVISCQKLRKVNKEL